MSAMWLRRSAGILCSVLLVTLPVRGGSQAGSDTSLVIAHAVPTVVASILGKGGLWVINGSSGRTEGQLPTGKATNPSLPQQVTAGHVYFATVANGRVCSWSIWQRYEASVAKDASFGELASLSAFAVTTDSRYFAFSVERGPSCDGPGAHFVLEIAKPSGQFVVSVDTSSVSAMAWIPGSDALTLAEVNRKANSVLLTIRNALSDRSYNAAVSVRCPASLARCSQYAPAYDTSGSLFYVAVSQCTTAVCGKQSYELVESAPIGMVVLARTEAVAGSEVWLAVNPAGTQALFSVGSHTYSWSRSGVRRLATSLAQETW